MAPVARSNRVGDIHVDEEDVGVGSSANEPGNEYMGMMVKMMEELKEVKARMDANTNEVKARMDANINEVKARMDANLNVHYEEMNGICEEMREVQARTDANHDALIQELNTLKTGHLQGLPPQEVDPYIFMFRSGMIGEEGMRDGNKWGKQSF